MVTLQQEGQHGVPVLAVQRLQFTDGIFVNSTLYDAQL